MNTRRFHTLPMLISALASLLCVSCSGDEPDPGVIWDILPYSVNFDLVDAQGNTYLDPDRSDGLYGQEITAEFGGETYEISDWAADPSEIPSNRGKSRMMFATFRGLHPVHSSFSTIQPDETDKRPEYVPSGTCWLRFGEFQSESAMEEDLIISIPSKNRTIKLHINHTFGWKKKRPNMSTTVTVDGKAVTYSDYKHTGPTNSENPYTYTSQVIKIQI